MKSNIKNKIIFIIFVATLMLIALNIKVYAEGAFSLDKESIDVKLNRTSYLYYSGGSGDITWTSSDPSIVTVDKGTVTGLKIGTATITATRGSETAKCTVNVVYSYLTIGGNGGSNISSVNLILGEHDSETLVASVEDGNFEEVSNPKVTWTSSDTSIATVDSSTGKITGIKAGTATITATAAGVSDTCKVTVYNAPILTDFSKAKYETTLNHSTETLQITGITPNADIYTNYYYMITSNNSKPNITMKSYGNLDFEKMSDSLEIFTINSDEKYIYTRNISKYAELNQDLYIWILQETKLGDYYYDTNGNSVSYSTQFVVEGKKITRPELPKLNLILQNFHIGYWNNTESKESDNYTYINFNFPTETENRKFKIKIGKVTDSSILLKIQNNDYAGITELLTYAKSHDSIYSQTLTTTSTRYFQSDTTLFDGNKLLEDKAYYYIYVEFDNENGKYYPIEGVTLGQAWLSSYSDSWDLWAYTSDDFKWDNLSPTSTNETEKKEDTKEDTTVASVDLPKTGIEIGLILIIIMLIGGALFAHFKYNKLKGI